MSSDDTSDDSRSCEDLESLSSLDTSSSRRLPDETSPATRPPNICAPHTSYGLPNLMQQAPNAKSISPPPRIIQPASTGSPSKLNQQAPSVVSPSTPTNITQLASTGSASQQQVPPQMTALQMQQLEEQKRRMTTRVYTLSFTTGVEVMRALEEFVNHYELNVGSIMCFCGVVENTVISVGGQARTIENARLITSGSGNISQRGGSRVHVSLVNKNGESFGGDLLSCTVAAGSCVDVALLEIPHLALSRPSRGDQFVKNSPNRAPLTINKPAIQWVPEDRVAEARQQVLSGAMDVTPHGERFSAGGSEIIVEIGYTSGVYESSSPDPFTCDAFQRQAIESGAFSLCLQQAAQAAEQWRPNYSPQQSPPASGSRKSSSPTHTEEFKISPPPMNMTGLNLFQQPYQQPQSDAQHSLSNSLKTVTLTPTRGTNSAPPAPVAASFLPISALPAPAPASALPLSALPMIGTGSRDQSPASSNNSSKRSSPRVGLTPLGSSSSRSYLSGPNSENNSSGYITPMSESATPFGTGNVTPQAPSSSNISFSVDVPARKYSQPNIPTPTAGSGSLQQFGIFTHKEEGSQSSPVRQNQNATSLQADDLKHLSLDAEKGWA